jgi:hypothetical protein
MPLEFARTVSSVLFLSKNNFGGGGGSLGLSVDVGPHTVHTLAIWLLGPESRL